MAIVFVLGKHFDIARAKKEIFFYESESHSELLMVVKSMAGVVTVDLGGDDDRHLVPDNFQLNGCVIKALAGITFTR